MESEDGITPEMVEAAARVLARKIDLNEDRWYLYAHAAELALRTALATQAKDA